MSKEAPLKIADQKPQSVQEAAGSIVTATTELSPEDHEHILNAHREAHEAQTAYEKAQAELQLRAAELNAARGAEQSFTNYLVKVYRIGPLDSIDIETGAITRAPA